MFSVRVKRQDYIYDENLKGPVYDDYAELSDYEKKLIEQYSDVEYDYSQFEAFNTESPPPAEEVEEVRKELRDIQVQEKYKFIFNEASIWIP